ncbi:MAG: alanine racemase, partial [Elusimicrobia bacterium]|nr:alanine racemase [Elusimicrobiota bacterium]
MSRRFFRPTWAEIDLGALTRNLRRIRAKMPKGTKIMFVVKANAYGHDAALCARAAEKARAADWLG